MKQSNTIAKNKLDRMKIIYDNDLGILDFLCELQDRRVIKDLDRFVKDSEQLSGMLLINCPLDDMVVLILTDDPFGFNEGDNKLIMYADTSLQKLAKYFKNMLVNYPNNTGDIYMALDDITRYLYFTWMNEQDKNTQTNFMG